MDDDGVMEYEETSEYVAPECDAMGDETEQDDAESLPEKAESAKLKGNEFYKNKKYREAIESYSAAIDLQPEVASYYGNRAAARIMLGHYREAADDAGRSVELDTTFTKGFLRLARCSMAQGNLQLAQESYKRAKFLEPSNKEAKEQMVLLNRVQNSLNEAEARHTAGDHRTALFMLERSLEHMPAALHLKLRRGEFLLALRRYQEAKEVADDLLQRHSNGMNMDAMTLRGLCLYYLDFPEKAMEHFSKVLRLAPDHTKAANAYRTAKRLLHAKEEGNKLVSQRKWREAIEAYSRALEIDPANRAICSKIYCNRAHAQMMLKEYKEAVVDCDRAIDMDDRYVKAFLRRAKCYENLEQWEECVRDYERINNISPSHEHRNLLKQAKLELKKSKRKDYYKILGVGKDAGEDEIKKAYKKRALLHHPDRHTNAEDSVKADEEKKFKEAGEAYAVLSDPNKKRRYDMGHDIEDLEGHGGMGGFNGVDPNEIFRMFFGGGAGPGGMPHGMHFGGHPGGASNFSFSFG